MEISKINLPFTGSCSSALIFDFALQIRAILVIQFGHKPIKFPIRLKLQKGGGLSSALI